MAGGRSSWQGIQTKSSLIISCGALKMDSELGSILASANQKLDQGISHQLGSTPEVVTEYLKVPRTRTKVRPSSRFHQVTSQKNCDIIITLLLIYSIIFNNILIIKLVHNILYALSHNRKSLFFQWAWTRHDAGIESSSIPASHCVQAY